MATHTCLPTTPLATAVVPPPPPFDLIRSIETILTDFLDAEADTLTGLDPALEPLASTARAAVLAGGKRVRPLFAYWGWRGAGGEDETSAPLPAFAALELLHAFALVHDDVMDRSDTRRGKPTAHRSLAGLHRRSGLRGDAERFGDSMAVLVGDLCLVWADQLMARSGLPAEVITKARDGYDRMRVEAIAGQFLDVLGEASRDWPVDRALRTARLKTASYTVTRPLLFGLALTGRHDPALQAAYQRYGTAVGEAFQLRDDLLGLYGDPAVTGKPVGDDIGKPTMLLQLARSMADRSQRVTLEHLVRRAWPAETDRLGALIRQTGAVDRIHAMIGDRVGEAAAALAAAPIHPTAAETLAGLATTVTWRAA